MSTEYFTYLILRPDATDATLLSALCFNETVPFAFDSDPPTTSDVLRAPDGSSKGFWRSDRCPLALLVRLVVMMATQDLVLDILGNAFEIQAIDDEAELARIGVNIAVHITFSYHNLPLGRCPSLASILTATGIKNSSPSSVGTGTVCEN